MVLVEDRRMKYLVDVVEERAKDPVNVKGGGISDLGWVLGQRTNLANLGWILEDHKDDVAKQSKRLKSRGGKDSGRLIASRLM